MEVGPRIGTILINEPDLSIGLHKTLETLRSPFAERTIVVEEIHDGQIAIRIPALGAFRVVQDVFSRNLVVIRKSNGRQDQQRCCSEAQKGRA